MSVVLFAKLSIDRRLICLVDCVLNAFGLRVPQTPAYQIGTFVNADTKADLEAAMQVVRQEMATGGRFEFTDRRQRETSNDRFAAMQVLFDKYGRVDKVPDERKLELFNYQAMER